MRNKDDIEQIIRDEKIIAIFRGFDREQVLRTSKALNRGGLRCVEVTFNQCSTDGNSETIETLKLLKKELGDRMCIGAGTVMSSDQLRSAYQAGAEYIISPNFDEKIVKETVELGLVSIPSALSPTEIVNCHQTGASFVKIFPANEMGTSYMRAVKAPLSHIPMLAVGNIDISNIGDFLACGIDGVGLGGSLLKKDLIDSGRFDELTELTAEYVAIAKKNR